jgi:hypothetical protein
MLVDKRFPMDAAPILTKTSDLDKRFNICKNARVNRLAMLGLTPNKLLKQGKFYMLTPEQVELFTDFDQYLLLNGTAEGYSKLATASVVMELDESSDTFEAEETAEPWAMASEPEDPAASGSLVISMAEELEETPEPAEAEYDYTESSYQTDSFACAQGDRSTQILVQNAQRRATALLMAENALAQQYMENPSLLSPELQAQIGSLQHREIDPKELAASLIASAQGYKRGAA